MITDPVLCALSDLEHPATPDEQLLAQILRRCTVQWHRVGETVCGNSQHGRAVFLLLFGRIAIYEGEDCVADQAAPSVLGLVSQPGRMLLCIATERACIGRLSAEDSAALADDHTPLGALYRGLLSRSGISASFRPAR